MNKLAIAIVCCVVIVLAPHKAYSEELNINFHRQHTMVWCWAATIAMVVEYVAGNSIQDCEVLSRYDRSLGGAGACCYGDGMCVRTGQISEMRNILGQLFGIRGRYIPRPPSYQELKNSIINNHPLIATLQNPTGGGHVVVISGYENPGKVIVLDPMHGRHIVDYQILISNFQYGYWTGSFLITPETSNMGGANPILLPPITLPQPASQCVTTFGSCFINVPIPIGSACTCFTSMGQIPGITR